MSKYEQKRMFGGDTEDMKDTFILGIDFGTTNSVVSYWDAALGKPVPIDVSGGFGKAPMPSVAQYREDTDEWIIGEEAFRSMKIYPEHTIRSVKRMLGTNQTVIIGGKSYSPEEIAAMILKELIKHVYSVNPNAEISGVVVSVPYDFDDAAKKAVMRACMAAGFADNLICLIEEPKAAALAYNFKQQLYDKERIMVFDFGGGTLDITIFEVVFEGRNKIKMQVVSEGGEAYHGGDNADDLLMEKFFEFINEKTGQTKDTMPKENQIEVYSKARETKERLSGASMFRVPFTFCVPPFIKQFTQNDFEDLLLPFIDKTRRLTLKALRDAYTGPISPAGISRVLMEGGSCQMPWVKEMLADIIGDATKIYSSETPALDISIGAAYYAAMKTGLLEARDIETEKRAVVFETTVPHDIGFEIMTGGRRSFYSMIKRGTVYALAKKSKEFTLSGETENDMTSFKLKILERLDKDDSVEKCRFIGEVSLTGLPRRPSGKTRLNITLLAEEEGGLIKGVVEDMGCGSEYPPSGYKRTFDPSDASA